MLQEIVTGCASLGGPPELDAFRKHLPREWIEEAVVPQNVVRLRDVSRDDRESDHTDGTRTLTCVPTARPARVALRHPP